MKNDFILTSLLLAFALICVCCLACGGGDISGSESDVCVGTDEYSAPSAGCIPSVTAEPAVIPTEAPAEQTAEPSQPAATLPELSEEDRALLVLVNFENPIYTEPPVALISDYLTANNVTCDPRRHADERAVKALNEMLLAAAREGEYHFVIASAFRTISEQSILWNGRSNQDPAYGSDPYNYPVSVMPKNSSEHTTGLAFDLLCDNCPHSDPSFIYTAEGIWLAENAWKFGFVLRYPEDKTHLTGVRYEPWHYRYVGRTAAKYMYENCLCLEELAALLGK